MALALALAVASHMTKFYGNDHGYCYADHGLPENVGVRAAQENAHEAKACDKRQAVEVEEDGLFVPVLEQKPPDSGRREQGVGG